MRKNLLLVLVVSLKLTLESVQAACLGLSEVYGYPQSIVYSDMRQAKKVLDAKNANTRTAFQFAVMSSFDTEDKTTITSSSL